jgi:uncharacterized protein (DUF1684 family)
MTARFTASTFLLAGLAAAIAAGCSREAPSGATTPPPAAAATPAPATPAPPLTVEEWRAKHETDYRRDFVTIAGLFPLKQGVNTAGSTPGLDVVLPTSTPPVVGRFVLTGQQVRFEPAEGVNVTLRGAPVTAPIDLKDDRTRETDELVIGDVRLVVHATGESRTIRVRDPNGAMAREFLGFRWFDVDPAYRVVGRFIADAQPQKLKVLNTFGDVDEYTSEGVVEFTLQGKTLRLRPFTTRPKRFYFVFKDASSGKQTYEAARFLYADLEDDGTAVLDFNRAYNPPCAFNPYTTCPIPLRENRLPIEVLAGEKAYPKEVKLPVRQ